MIRLPWKCSVCSRVCLTRCSDLIIFHYVLELHWFGIGIPYFNRCIRRSSAVSSRLKTHWVAGSYHNPVESSLFPGSSWQYSFEPCLPSPCDGSTIGVPLEHFLVLSVSDPRIFFLRYLIPFIGYCRTVHLYVGERNRRLLFAQCWCKALCAGYHVYPVDK